MPTTFDCCGYAIYIRREDGTFEPFHGISEAKIVSEEINREDLDFVPMVNWPTEITITAKANQWGVKRLWKSIRTDQNRKLRMYRTWKRWKEKVRRARLKHGQE